MKYYLAFKKEENSDIVYNVHRSWKHYTKWNKPGTKGQILQDSAYMKYLKSQIHRKKVEW